MLALLGHRSFQTAGYLDTSFKNTSRLPGTYQDTSVVAHSQHVDSERKLGEYFFHDISKPVFKEYSNHF